MGSNHNKLEAECKKILLQFGWFTWKNLQNTYRRAVPEEVKGVPDRFAMKDGRFLAFEFKTGEDRQRPEQKRFADQFEKNGGAYVLVRRSEDVLTALRVRPS